MVDSTKKTTGRYLEIVGTWNPAKKTKIIDKDKIDAWVKKGAAVSTAVKKLMNK